MSILATAVIGFLGLFIAYRQWRTAQDKLMLDLFDRRYAIYREIMKAAEGHHLGKNSHQVFDIIDHLVTQRDMASFLFGPEVTSIIREMVAEIYYLHALDGASLEKRLDAIELLNPEKNMPKVLTKLDGLRENLTVAVSPYMAMRHRAPTGWWTNQKGLPGQRK